MRWRVKHLCELLHAPFRTAYAENAFDSCGCKQLRTMMLKEKTNFGHNNRHIAPDVGVSILVCQ